MALDLRALQQAQQQGGGSGRKPIAAPRTVQTRNFKGVNTTDARVAIGDDEFSWIENALTVGAGAIQILPGPGTSIATIAAGISSLWGFTLALSGVATPVLISINTDGSATQIAVPGGATTVVAAAGTFTPATTTLTIWRDSPILIVDNTAGYHSWDGTTLTVRDAARVGTSIAVFQGRVWIGRIRTIAFTAPNSFTSFVAGDGAGSTIITDEAFPGEIISLISAFEQLWVLGQGAIEAISNVQSTGTAPTVVTTFTVTNIVAGLGTASAASHAGYFRALTFMSPFGAYALSGVTPQKLSDKLDGLFPGLTLGACPAAVVVVESLLVLVYLVTYTPSLVPDLPTPASGLNTAAPLLLCFTSGKWFFATQGTLTYITSVLVSGVAQAWGTNGTTITRLFGAAATTSTAYKVQSKLYDYGLATTMKSITKFGFEYQGPDVVAPTVTIDSEIGEQTTTLDLTNEIVWINDAGAVVQWQNDAAQDITWVAAGMVLSRTVANMYGRYLGETITGTDPPYRIQAIQKEIILTREWDSGP